LLSVAFKGNSEMAGLLLTHPALNVNATNAVSAKHLLALYLLRFAQFVCGINVCFLLLYFLGTVGRENSFNGGCREWTRTCSQFVIESN
jgi:hypothetical protein